MIEHFCHTCSAPDEWLKVTPGKAAMLHRKQIASTGSGKSMGQCFSSHTSTKVISTSRRSRSAEFGRASISRRFPSALHGSRDYF
jgi:hypothetical protein